MDIDGKYGNIYIDGRVKNIDMLKPEELEMYYNKLQEKRAEIIQQQNEYITQILK